MLGLEDKLKQIIAWVGLGASLVVYANTNFATKEQVEKNTDKLEKTANADDIKRLEGKIDTLTEYLLNRKN